MKDDPSTRTKVPSRSLAEILGDLSASVSASRLGLFHACRLRFFFRHVLGLTRPKAAALHLGVTVHQTLRAWNRARWRQETPSFGSMYAAYEEAWIMGQTDEPVAWENPAEADQQKQVGWRLLETFFRETSLVAAGKPEAVEARVTPAAAFINAAPDQPETTNENHNPQEERNTTMQNGSSNHNGDGHHPAAETSPIGERPALEQALDQIESVKITLRGAVTNLNNLVDTLRQLQRERRLSEREIRSVRGNLKALQTVRL